MSSMRAKYPGTCWKCGGAIAKGDTIEWEKGRGASHLACKDKPAPALNSPPPVDSAGNVDPTEEAAKYGRKAVVGATVSTFSRRMQGKGDKCIASGSVERIRGRRYVAIAHSKPRYFSRDDLEDFDDFDQKPGLWYDWQGVEVEPTATERADDEKVATEKAERERASKRRKEITSHVCNSANQVDHLPPGLQDCWGRRGMAGSEVTMSDGTSLVAVTQSSYDDGAYIWVVRDAALAAETVALKEPIR